MLPHPTATILGAALAGAITALFATQAIAEGDGALAISALPVTALADTALPAGVSLRTHVTTGDDILRLGDIFQPVPPALAGIAIAYAPEPGRRAIFDSNWLAAVARANDLEWRPPSRLARLTVERASTVVVAADIEAALSKEMAARNPGEAFELTLSNRRFTLNLDPRISPTIEVLSLTVDPRSARMRATVAIPAGAANARRVEVTGHVYPLVEVPILARRVAPGEIITVNDIDWIDIREGRLRANTITDAVALVGMEARRPIRAGTPVRRIDLRAPVTIEKGDLVTMVFRTASMMLTAIGQVRQDGAEGDIVSVVNLQTRKSVEAVILGPNRVEVVSRATAIN